MNPEFEVHMLNEEGIQKCQHTAELFDNLLNNLTALMLPGRELSIVRTKLEEASFFAKKGLAKDPSNQK